MSDIVVNSIDIDGSSNHPDQQHINDTIMDSMVDPTGPHTGVEEFVAGADLEAGNPHPGAEEFVSVDLEARNPDPTTELPVATPAAQPENVAAVEPQMNRDPGLLPILSTAAFSASLAAIVQPTPKGLYSHSLLLVAYTWDVIMLLVLGILLYGLTFALDKVPNNWLRPLRAIMTAVAGALLLLLLLLATFVGYGLIFRDIHN